MESPVRLNDEYGVDYDNDREEVVIYANDSGHPPQKLLVLTEQQMWQLNDWWMVAHCLCGNAIPQAHYLCANCLNEAVSIQQHQLSA